jgi:hypothetical protein
MNILHITKGLINAFLLKIFPSLGPKGVVDTQITVYKRLKKKFPTASENDLLNSLIISRIKAPLSPTSSQEEYAHYELILQNPDKTLRDVIWTIVEYEYILSREEDVFNQFSKMSFSPTFVLTEMNDEKARWRRYIKESIIENVDYPNIEFRKLRRDYKSFLWFSPAIVFGMVLGISESFSIPSIPDSILIIFGLLFSLGWYLYAVKVVIGTFKVFKIIKPSVLQIGISVFLFWLFFLSPLVMGLYVIHLINKYKQMNKINLGDFR